MSKDEKKCDEEKWTREELEACLESGPLAICPPHRFLTFRARTDFFGMTSENYYDHVIQVDIIFKDRWHTIEAFLCRDGSVAFLRGEWPMKQKAGDFAKALWNAPVVRLSNMREDEKLGEMKSLLVYWVMCAGHIDAFIEKGPVSQDKLQAAMDVLAKVHTLPDLLGKCAASPAGDGEGEMEGGREGQEA
jgi:hypothetical protein